MPASETTPAQTHNLGRAGDFTRSGYVALIEAFVAAGYRTVGFHDAAPERADLILRHDVDMDLGRAQMMAEIEAERGWRATYFVLIRSEFYNAAGREGIAALRQIDALGHEVGLHFDARLYPDDPVVLAAALQWERRLLESLVERPVRTFSLHRPAALSTISPLAAEDMTDVYGSRFTAEFEYVSDSRGAWRHGHPLERPAFAARRGIHLLTHPIWWMSEGGSPAEMLVGFLEERTAALDQELAVHCAAHQPGRLSLQRKTP